MRRNRTIQVARALATDPHSRALDGAGTADLAITTRRARIQRRIAVFHSSIAVAIVVSGFLDLIHESWPATILVSGGTLRFCFGFMLVGLIISRRYWRSRMSPAATRLYIRQQSRRTSRLIYLIIYAVFGAQAIICLFADRSLSSFATELQRYLLAGVGALVLIRLLEMGGRTARHNQAGTTGRNPYAKLSSIRPIGFLLRRFR
jgi:hypothetical protein